MGWNIHWTKFIKFVIFDVLRWVALSFLGVRSFLMVGEVRVVEAASFGSQRSLVVENSNQASLYEAA